MMSLKPFFAWLSPLLGFCHGCFLGKDEACSKCLLTNRIVKVSRLVLKYIKAILRVCVLKGENILQRLISCHKVTWSNNEYSSF